MVHPNYYGAAYFGCRVDIIIELGTTIRIFYSQNLNIIDINYAITICTKKTIDKKKNTICTRDL